MTNPRRAIRLATAGAMLACVGCATPAPIAAAPESRQYFHCQIQREDAPGRLIFQHEIGLDGTPGTYSVTWLRVSTRWIAQFDASGDRLPGPGDDMSVLFTIPATWRGAPSLRVELFRSTDPPSADAPRLASRYESRRSWVITHWRRNELRAFAADSPELVVRVVGRRGDVRAEFQIESRVFHLPDEALASARPEIEAVVSDFRNRCPLETEDWIVVT
jgi:hypothetical protein